MLLVLISIPLLPVRAAPSTLTLNVNYPNQCVVATACLFKATLQGSSPPDGFSLSSSTSSTFNGCSGAVGSNSGSPSPSCSITFPIITAGSTATVTVYGSDSQQNTLSVTTLVSIVSANPPPGPATVLTVSRIIVIPSAASTIVCPDPLGLGRTGGTFVCFSGVSFAYWILGLGIVSDAGVGLSAGAARKRRSRPTERVLDPVPQPYFDESS